MVPKAYIEKYQTPDAVDPEDRPTTHARTCTTCRCRLAAERGLPALALWLVVRRRRPRSGSVRRVPSRPGARAGRGAALAAIVAMLAAGLFEYNFGDSEFLMLFLGLITLPFAAAATPPADIREPSRDPAPVPALRTHA